MPVKKTRTENSWNEYFMIRGCA